MSKENKNGWICPKCGRVYAPWVDKCQYCGGSTITYTPPTCPYHGWWCTNPYYTNTITTDTVTLSNVGSGSTTTTTNATLNNEVKC